MTRSVSLPPLAVTAFVCLVATSLLQAQAANKPNHLKKDQLLADALTENGLGSGPIPWHVRAKFDTLDPAGKRKGGGTFEEWWFGPKSFKTVLETDDLHQTNVATSAGLFRSGDQAWPSGSSSIVPQLLISPLSIHAYDPKRHELVDEMRAMSANSTNKLRCVFLLHKPAPDERPGANLNANLDITPVDCFEPDSTILRYRSDGGRGSSTLFNDVAHFANHNVAREIVQLSGGKVALTVHIADFGPIAAGTAAPMPPEGSQGPLGGRVSLTDPLPVVAGRLELPPLTDNDADIAVKIVVGKDGHVIDATPAGGPPDLSAKAAKAARKLVFAPFMVLDAPVEAEFTFHTKGDPGSAGQPGGGRR